jgi:hypothetical protein
MYYYQQTSTLPVLFLHNIHLKRIAKEYGRQYDKQISETIQKNMYVDDCLVSSESDDKAVELVDNLKSL